ncbi:MAG: hypothetical protein N2512_02690 [Armatimonadetes bacterium]|nr:hypothetical protein [Armatimonadota bacterium]
MNSTWRFAMLTLGLIGTVAFVGGCGGGGGGGVKQIVVGTVRCGDTEQPAVGVQVQIGDYDPVVTDNNGQFRVEDVVAPRTYTVEIPRVTISGRVYEKYEAQIRVQAGTGDPRTWDMGVIYLAPAPPPTPQL